MSADAELLDAVAEVVRSTPRGVTTAREVADRLAEEHGIERTRRSVVDDLRVLERAGEAESFEAGASAVVWWAPERITSPPPPTPDDHPDQSQLDEPDAPVANGGREGDGE